MSEDAFSGSSTEDLIENEPKVRIHYYQLFKYAPKFEIALFLTGLLLSALVGMSIPLSFVLFADLVDDFIDPTTGNFKQIIEYMSILGAITFVIAFLQMFCIQYVARNQLKRIRRAYFSSILRQDAAWFDSTNVGTLITRLTEGVDKIEMGVGEKAGLFVQNISVFASGFVISMIKNWELTLVSAAIFPVVCASFAAVGCVIRKLSAQERAAYSRANSVAGEVFASIKTIFAFEGQEKEAKRYAAELVGADRAGVKRSTICGFVIGSTDASIYVLMAVTFYYGIVMLTRGSSSPGDIIYVVISMLFGGITIGQAFQQVDYFNFAVTAAAEIFPTIDRVPVIDKTASEGKARLPDLQCNIVFEDVTFYYPTRPDVIVLKNFSWRIRPGQNLAIVGPSGSGKSTIIQLIQRLYDPVSGRITVDGVDLRDLDLSWWRGCLGVVSQEPILFAGSIEQNIALGRADSTQEDVVNAAKLAHAHDFISKLPEAYQTVFSTQDGGGGMSGGQKQRVAIARALIRDPRIMLLDEATSALDTRSEKAVQSALDDATKGRTTITVAHRLSTIRDANVIVVLDRGKVVEAGSHEELMRKAGVYADLAQKGEASKGATKREDGGGKSEDDDDEEDDDNVEEIIKAVQHQQDREKGDLVAKADEAKSEVKSISSSISDSSDELVLEKKPNTFVEILRLNKPEAWYLVLGCFTSLLIGGMQTAFVIVYTEMYDIFAVNDTEVRYRRSREVCIGLGALSAARLICYTLNGFAFGVAGQRLTSRCRQLLFESILNQEVAWFDRPENQPGSLTGRLAADVPTLQNLTGRRLASLLEMFVVITTALFIGFYYSWQITLVALAYFPVLVIAGAFEMQSWGTDITRKSVKGAAVAQETFSASKTVTAMQAESHFVDSYSKQALLTKAQILKGVARYALVNAVANSLMCFEFAGVFYVGGILLQRAEISVFQLWRAYSAISFAASNLGYTASFAPDAKKASVASKAILEILHRHPRLPPNEGLFPDKGGNLTGRIVFDNLKFRYPIRKKVQVLKGFTFTVPAGKSVALVGQSGCGKSTILQLLQRFYDTPTGIHLDDHNLHDLAPNWVRRQVGMVSQEPNLLDTTIRENIAYGLNQESSEPTLQRIIEAAKQANAHDFISDLPQGYETPVGPRGSRLSGGQKQRIAIARALIREPPLLLLDEATAALDAASERIVQQALDEAMRGQGRTCLVVAHRLSTVEACDLVVVMEDGKAVEWGTPQALLEKKGAYYALHNAV